MKRERSLSEPWHGLEMDESERPASTFTCPDCGALYEGAVRNQVSRTMDHVRCEICGTVMVAWCTASVPFFKLIKPPESRTE
jgi:predicted RNA-binding Zn-ribbon protein involved in translation (DUF1610 family)